MTKNKYNVSKALWNKWTETRREFYNDLREQTSDQDFIMPTGLRVTEEQYDIISHNFAVHVVSNMRTKKDELKLWNYLKKKLKGMKDNNLTAREIFERITR